MLMEKAEARKRMSTVMRMEVVMTVGGMREMSDMAMTITGSVIRVHQMVPVVKTDSLDL